MDASCGFTNPDSPLGADFTPEIQRINQLLEQAHSTGWPVFCSTVVYHEAEEARVFRDKLPALNVLTPDSPWVSLDPRLNLRVDDVIFNKTHASCFHDTQLTQWLTAKFIDTLIIAGFTTSGCVRASAVDAIQNDLRTIVVSDAVGDRDAKAHAANLHDLGLKYADLYTTDALIRPL